MRKSNGLSFFARIRAFLFETTSLKSGFTVILYQNQRTNEEDGSVDDAEAVCDSGEDSNPDCGACGNPTYPECTTHCPMYDD